MIEPITLTDWIEEHCDVPLRYRKFGPPEDQDFSGYFEDEAGAILGYVDLPKAEVWPPEEPDEIDG